MTLFDFKPNSDVSNWKIVDDAVMGGQSKGHFKLNAKGYGEFSGHIFLENNGGFSSLSYNFKQKELKQYSKVVLRVKGDGKTYQFRIRTHADDKTSYVSKFKTTQDWMTIELPFKDMQAQSRGHKLDQPNFDGGVMEQVNILIGNNTEESFMLLIDWIKLEA